MSTQRWVLPLAWATLVANIVLGRHRRRRAPHRVRSRLPDLAALHRPVVPAARALDFHSGHRVRQPDAHLRPHRDRDSHVRGDVAHRPARPAGDVADHRPGIPAQAIVGGITVLTDLNPWVVSLHLLVSLAIIGVAVRLLLSVPAPLPAPQRGPTVALAWATFAAAWAVLYVGTVVTGSGPHAGDADTERNGLSPLQMSQLHADLVFLFVGLTLGLLFALMARAAPPPRVRPWSSCSASSWPRARSGSSSTSPTCRRSWSASTCSGPR